MGVFEDTVGLVGRVAKAVRNGMSHTCKELDNYCPLGHLSWYTHYERSMGATTACNGCGTCLVGKRYWKKASRGIAEHRICDDCHDKLAKQMRKGKYK